MTFFILKRTMLHNNSQKIRQLYKKIKNGNDRMLSSTIKTSLFVDKFIIDSDNAWRKLPQPSNNVSIKQSHQPCSQAKTRNNDCCLQKDKLTRAKNLLFSAISSLFILLLSFHFNMNV